MSSFSRPSEPLAERLTTLRSEWQHVRDRWHDPIGDRFERQFWNEFESILPACLGAIKQLEDLLISAEEGSRCS